MNQSAVNYFWICSCNTLQVSYPYFADEQEWVYHRVEEAGAGLLLAGPLPRLQEEPWSFSFCVLYSFPEWWSPPSSTSDFTSLRSHNNWTYPLEKHKYSHLKIYKMRSSKIFFAKLNRWSFASNTVLSSSLIGDVELWVSRQFVPNT